MYSTVILTVINRKICKFSCIYHNGALSRYLPLPVLEIHRKYSFQIQIYLGEFSRKSKLFRSEKSIFDGFQVREVADTAENVLSNRKSKNECFELNIELENIRDALFDKNHKFHKFVRFTNFAKV